MIFAFAEFEIDEPCREVRSSGRTVHVEPQVFDLLVYLIRHRARVVAKAELLEAVWDGRIVSDATLGSRMNAARRAIGDTGEAQKVIRTIARRGFRFVAEVLEYPPWTPPRSQPPSLLACINGVAARQRVTFCTTPDRIRLAVGRMGTGAPLVKAADWPTHLDDDLRSPLLAPLYLRLAHGHHFVRYDMRGTGLSDRHVADISFEGFVRDLETVIDHLALDRVSLLGISQGAAVAIAYAARHPERVDRLVLAGACALGRRRRNSVAEADKGELMLGLMKQGWGKSNSVFMKAFGAIHLPDATDDQLRWFTELQTMAAPADNAVRIRLACDDIDVSAELAGVRAATLVLHARGDNVVPLDQGRSVAAGIAAARFVVLDTANHIALPGEPAWTQFVDHVETFLA